VIQAIRERDPHRFIRKAWPWAAVVVVAFFLTLGNRQTANQAQSAAQEARATAERVQGLVGELQSALVQSCELNTNVRVKVQREEIHEEIHEAEHPDPEAFKALVEAGVSEAAIFESEEKLIVKLKDRLEQIVPTDCAHQYHIGSGVK